MGLEQQQQPLLFKQTKYCILAAQGRSENVSLMYLKIMYLLNSMDMNALKGNFDTVQDKLMANQQ